MSETVKYIGTLKEIKPEGNQTIEDIAKSIVNEEKDDYYTDWVEQLLDQKYDQYVVHDGKLYEVERSQDDDDDDIFQMHKNPDGTLGFVVRYYNGGCGFEEAIQYAFRSLKDE